MRTSFQVLARSVLLFGSAWLLLALGSSARGGEVRVNGRTFALPEGFELEVVAEPPLVERPIVVDFDEQGRLYVADSSGSNEKVEKQLEVKPHRILRLEDTNGDGRFDRQTVFADRMMFPEGVMWREGSLYVAAPPSIWKLTDTDGDGVADERVEWFQGKTLTGCANDLHGPYPGPDGWIYWCKGAFARQTYERPGRPPLVTRAAHIFRCRPDGSGIEPVMTGGMDNPVDVVFTPGGERIFTTTFLQHPAGGRRDGLIHAIYGGVYGKVHDVIEGHPRTSPDVMPVLAHLGPAAPCGLTRYDASVFGPEYRDNLFASLFNMQKVTRHVLTPEGASFRSKDEDFLVSADRDFHPTDVQTDADGSLIVVDTGGWYKLCCPTSQLVKPDVLGAIYRVRRKGAPRVADPRGQKIAWAELPVKDLARLLDDPRPAVCRRAVETLAKRGGDAVSAIAQTIESGGSARARRNAVWAATRIDSADARAAVRSALSDSDGSVRQAALHSISLWRDRDAVPALIRVVEGRAPHLARGRNLDNQRAAAEALGRIGDPSAVPSLLAAVPEAQTDRIFEHSLIYALIEIGDARATAAGLASHDVAIHRASLIALDQMSRGGLDPRRVAADLTSPEASLKEIATWIISRHPEWGEALAGDLGDRLLKANASAADRTELVQLLAHLARSEAIQAMLATRLSEAAASPEARRLVLQVMAQSGLKQLPPAWAAALVELLSQDSDLSAQAIGTVRAVGVAREQSEELVAALLRVAGDERTASHVRLEALAAVPGGLKPMPQPVFDFVCGQLRPDGSVGARGAAADILGKAQLTEEQLEKLAEILKSAGPLETERLLAAFKRSSDETVGRKLIAALSESPARSALRPEALKPVLEKYEPALGKEIEALRQLLNDDARKQAGRLEKYLDSLAKGDVRRGQAVFNSPKAACASCHAIGYLGGKVGPDLTRIGQVRSDRDLLESIVYPSASFVRSFEPVTLATRDGKVYNGVVRKDASDEVVLATSATDEARIAREDIEEMRPGNVSVMPAGLDQQLTTQELADLVAFLRACK